MLCVFGFSLQIKDTPRIFQLAALLSYVRSAFHSLAYSVSVSSILNEPCKGRCVLDVRIWESSVEMHRRALLSFQVPGKASSRNGHGLRRYLRQFYVHRLRCYFHPFGYFRLPSLSDKQTLTSKTSRIIHKLFCRKNVLLLNYMRILKRKLANLEICSDGWELSMMSYFPAERKREEAR